MARDPTSVADLFGMQQRLSDNWLTYLNFHVEAGGQIGDDAARDLLCMANNARKTGRCVADVHDVDPVPLFGLRRSA